MRFSALALLIIFVSSTAVAQENPSLIVRSSSHEGATAKATATKIQVMGGLFATISLTSTIFAAVENSRLIEPVESFCDSATDCDRSSYYMSQATVQEFRQANARQLAVRGLGVVGGTALIMIGAKKDKPLLVLAGVLVNTLVTVRAVHNAGTSKRYNSELDALLP